MWLQRALGIALLAPGVDRQAMIAMMIIAAFGFEVIRMILGADRKGS